MLVRRKILAAVLAYWLLAYSSAGLALAGEPLELVKSAVERAFALLNDAKLKAADKKKERIEQLKAIVNPIFDYEEMGRRTLGAHWRRRTPAEQQEFVKLFRAFLEKIYSDRVELYEGERVVFGRESIDQEYAEVESKIVNAKNEESPVVYRLKRSHGKWLVYDAVVENISLVNNYRSQFDRVISKWSYDELRKMLKEKAA